MKLTQSLVAIAALSTLSFAGGDINPVTVFEQEPIMVPVEPVPAPAPAPAPAPVVVKAPPPPAPIPVPVVAPVSNDFYVALGATRLRASVDKGDQYTLNGVTETITGGAHGYDTGLTARLGYNFMSWLGAELRGTTAAGNDFANNGTRFKQYGAYLKPNFDIVDGLNLYGLLGASKANYTNAGDAALRDTGLSYGLGLDYSVSDSVSVFVDVMDYMAKSNTKDLYGATLGAAYNF